MKNNEENDMKWTLKFENSCWYGIWFLFTFLIETATFVLFFFAWLKWDNVPLMIAMMFLNIGFNISLSRETLKKRLLYEINKERD